jgi:hypothetical protein
MKQENAVMIRHIAYMIMHWILIKYAWWKEYHKEKNQYHKHNFSNDSNIRPWCLRILVLKFEVLIMTQITMLI